MKNNPSTGQLILFFASLLILVLLTRSLTKKNYTIAGKIWDVCVKTDFANPEKKCNYLITYNFNKDGTFFEYGKSASDSIQKKQSSKIMFWNLENEKLTIRVSFENVERTINHKIEWEDESTFYTTETNSMGITTETWYRLVDEY